LTQFSFFKVKFHSKEEFREYWEFILYFRIVQMLKTHPFDAYWFYDALGYWLVMMFLTFRTEYDANLSSLQKHAKRTLSMDVRMVYTEVNCRRLNMLISSPIVTFLATFVTIIYFHGISTDVETLLHCSISE